MKTPESHQAPPPMLPDHAAVRPAASRDHALALVPDERRILAFMSATRRMGRWSVPRVLRVRALMSDVKVDLRDVPIPDGFTLDVQALGAKVTLVVPPGTSVTFDVFVLMGNAISQADELGPEPATKPPISVRGSVFMGEVRVLVRERAS